VIAAGNSPAVNKPLQAVAFLTAAGNKIRKSCRKSTQPLLQDAALGYSAYGVQDEVSE
jgi:hypothetical protein